MARTAWSPGFRLWLLVGLFYLGWLKFWVPGAGIYLADYGQRLVILALAFVPLRDAFSPPLPLAKPRVWLFTVLGAVAILYLDLQTQGHAWRGAFDNLLFQGADFPPPPTALWNTVDLTFGLALVALSEELVFRKLWLDWWRSRDGATVPELYVGSTLAFAMLHFPQGLADTAVAAVWGLFLMAVYRRSGSLPLVVLVHYLADLWYFT